MPGFYRRHLEAVRACGCLAGILWVGLAIIYHLSTHLLEGLIELLHQAICLGVVDRGPDVFHMQQPIQITHELRDERRTLVC